MRVDPKIKQKNKAGKADAQNEIIRKLALAMVFLVIYFFFVKLLFL